MTEVLLRIKFKRVWVSRHIVHQYYTVPIYVDFVSSRLGGRDFSFAVGTTRRCILILTSLVHRLIGYDVKA